MSVLETPYEEIEQFQLFNKNYPPFVGRMSSSHGETVVSSPNKNQAPILLDLEIADTEVCIFQGITYHKKFRGKKGLLYKVEASYTRLTWRGQEFDTDILLFDEMGKCVHLIPNSNTGPNKHNTIFWQYNFVIELNAGFIKRNKITTDFYLDITPFCEWGDRTHPFERSYMKPVIIQIKDDQNLKS